MQQLLLPLAIERARMSSADFVVSCCNLEAYKAVTCSDIIWPSNRLLLVGEAGSGKTHLANLWQQCNGAACIKQPMALEQNQKQVIVEDIENFAQEAELLQIINLATEHQATLLMTTRNFKTFNISDLRSRINATYKILIKSPSEDMVRELMRKMLRDRQLKVAKEVLDYLAIRLERSFRYVHLFIDHLDQLSQREKRNITIPLAKDVLKILEKTEYLNFAQH